MMTNDGLSCVMVIKGYPLWSPYHKGWGTLIGPIACGVGPMVRSDAAHLQHPDFVIQSAVDVATRSIVTPSSPMESEWTKFPR